MYQGFIIAIIYCFTNKEVRSVLKTHYGRFKLQHASAVNLRRGSRPNVVRNGTSIEPSSLRLTENDNLLKTLKYSFRNKRQRNDPSTSALISTTHTNKE
ncbi:unnamed protein product [Onchocerca flexuosa]|uniref:DUF4817 domain-containing protein n=1 Tax=Onchocerca flexuosa TaxID=387005 RepID=A0A183I157_9BILA|nr:unnamed protein product [Onchocerca flexuosa]